MNREQKLKIAREGYRKVQGAIEEVEAAGVCRCHWDECMTVDDEFFHGHELKGEDEGYKKQAL